MIDLDALYGLGPFDATTPGGRVTTRDGRSFFLKTVPGHSDRKDLEVVYQLLDDLVPVGYGMIRPVRSAFGRLIERTERGSVMLLPWCDFVSCASRPLPLDRLMRDVSALHADLAKLRLPERAEKTFTSYHRRGLGILQSKFPNHPFTRSYAGFVEDRLPMLKFVEGNLHFDLNPTNLGRDTSDRTVFLDFDDVQPGPYLKDVCEVLAGYCDDERPIPEIDFARFTDAEESDLRFLLLRPRMPDFSHADLERALFRIS